MALRAVDTQMMVTRPLEMTADRARDMRQTGLTANTIQDINRDAASEMRRVQHTPEAEETRLRTGDEGGNNAGDAGHKEKEHNDSAPAQIDLSRLASEKLLSVPVNSKNVSKPLFDMRV